MAAAAHNMIRGARIAGAALLVLASCAGAQTSSDTTLRIVISLSERRLWVINDAGDTLRTATVAVGSGLVLRYGDSTWLFRTPTGISTVKAKEENPVWIPPQWHYLEIARQQGLRVDQLDWNHPVSLSNGAALAVRASTVGLIESDSVFRALPTDEEIIFDSTLYVPPFGTKNRRIERVLGPYRLLLANGVGLHGTIFPESIGKAVTHGCVRLLDDDIAWLYERVPLGTRVIIY